jgi:hypothetical protein
VRVVGDTAGIETGQLVIIKRCECRIDLSKRNVSISAFYVIVTFLTFILHKTQLIAAC